jgi:tRNA dimethylallyltransferase
LAIELAPKLNAEIISMDSMALYRGMDIGTAKPTLAERNRVPHHLIDVLEPWESANVSWWLEQAKILTQEIQKRGKQVLFVGGTPLYLKTLMFGLFQGPKSDAVLRKKLEDEAKLFGAESLHQRLAQVDPAAARRIHLHDLRRLIRALEVFELSGKPISQWQNQWPGETGHPSPSVHPSPEEKPMVQDQILCLVRPRDELYERIEKRVDAMFAQGFVEEVRALRNLAKPLSQEASQALGYQEVGRFLAGEIGLPETIASIKIRSRQFAKRQLTWFRHLPGCQLIDWQLTREKWQGTI